MAAIIVSNSCESIILQVMIRGLLQMTSPWASSHGSEEYAIVPSSAYLSECSWCSSPAPGEGDAIAMV
eukprot:CAMPEP_0115176812 /NCGR_PEP_ID=MMETSP0270-20121206/5061_1 /TAXON_ID=71861 /ORGANISM="Scrippsiella trochoidea, Strain CCMP3099" /LENGTH=67 /DNA_ID=CAMNT_0002589721 /DNA_START=224 /DNA_END=423 /DNA_ORIENTATION=+